MGTWGYRWRLRFRDLGRRSFQGLMFRVCGLGLLCSEALTFLFGNEGLGSKLLDPCLEGSSLMTCR